MRAPVDVAVAAHAREPRIEAAPVEERSHVQARTADDVRGLPAGRDVGERRARVALVAGGVVRLARIDEIDAVMANARALDRGRLRGADVHPAIHLARVSR